MVDKKESRPYGAVPESILQTFFKDWGTELSDDERERRMSIIEWQYPRPGNAE